MKTIAFAIAITVGAVAQTPAPPEKKPAFEVASIRMVKDDGHHNMDSDQGFLRTHNISLKRLIATAYGVDVREIEGGPSWGDGDGFDINAKLPAESAEERRETLPLMIQSLLAERFQLVFTREPRQISGYALVLAKKGSKMTPAQPGQEGSHFNSHNTHMVARNATMDGLAQNLSRNREIGLMVVDKTGLTGAFDFELDWKAEALIGKPEASNDDLPSIFTALQEQLGLRLEATKVPVQAIVIARAEKPTEN